MSVDLRLATAEDLPSVLAIAEKSPTAPQWDRSHYEQMLQGNSAASLVRRFEVCFESGEVTGFFVATALCAMQPPQAELEMIAVHPEGRGRGLGRLLLQQACAWAAEQGAEEILLEVRAENMPALRLYRAAGFEDTGLRPGYYAHPVEAAVCMRLILPDRVDAVSSILYGS